MSINAAMPAVGQVWKSSDKRDATRDTRFRIMERSAEDSGFAVVENMNGPPRRRKIRLGAFLGTNRYTLVTTPVPMTPPKAFGPMTEEALEEAANNGGLTPHVARAVLALLSEVRSHRALLK